MLSLNTPEKWRKLHTIVMLFCFSFSGTEKKESTLSSIRNLPELSYYSLAPVQNLGEEKNTHVIIIIISLFIFRLFINFYT